MPIKIDSRAVQRALTNLAQKQIPFATALAINAVAATPPRLTQQHLDIARSLY